MRRGVVLLCVAAASVGALHAPEGARRSVPEVFGAAASVSKPWRETWMGPRKNRPTSIPQYASVVHPGADPAFVAALSALPEKIQETRIGLVAAPADGVEAASRGQSACILFPAFTVATCLGTNNWDGAQRSRKMLEDFGIPLLEGLAARLTAAGCLGVGLAYGAADLSKGANTSTPEGEYVGIVALQAELRALASGKLKREELLHRSEVFARHVGSRSLAKIELPAP